MKQKSATTIVQFRGSTSPTVPREIADPGSEEAKLFSRPTSELRRGKGRRRRQKSGNNCCLEHGQFSFVAAIYLFNTPESFPCFDLRKPNFV